MLSLPGCAPAVAEKLTLRFSRQRPARRAISRRVYENQARQKSDHEREFMRGVRWKDRESSTRILLFDLPEHASQPASRIRDGAPALAPIAGQNVGRVRLAFSSRRVRPKTFQTSGRDRVLGPDQQTGLARVRAESTRNRVARVCAWTVFVARIDPGCMGQTLLAANGHKQVTSDE